MCSATIKSLNQEIGRENLEHPLSKQNPLPIGYHFHSQYWQFREQLFSDGANYIGHELMVPNVGDYRVLETMNDQYILLRRDDGTCVMLSNICRHQQARLIDPKNRPYDKIQRPNGDHRSGNLKSLNRAGFLICPIHRWSYKLDGKVHHAPKFGPHPNLCLPVIELQSWNGLLFHTQRDIASDMSQLGHSGYFNPNLIDMCNYVYVGSDEPVHYEFSWEKFITVYLDLYHVAPYHPKTFVQIIDCHDFKWEFSDRYNVQIAGWSSLSPPPSSKELAYGKIRTLINKHYTGAEPPHGALWLLLFPGVMIEWYPHVLVISILRPLTYETCVNYVEYYAPKDWYHSSDLKYEQKILKDAKHAYQLSAVEDMEICQTMQDSYRTMWDSGEHFIGPFHPHLELGTNHFFKYVHNEWEAKYNSAIADIKKHEYLGL